MGQCTRHGVHQVRRVLDARKTHEGQTELVREKLSQLRATEKSLLDEQDAQTPTWSFASLQLERRVERSLFDQTPLNE